MSGLDPQVAMHRLNINPDAKQVKQQQRRFRPEIMEAIDSEVKKLIDSGFVRQEQHPDWIANVAPVLKKNRKIQICIDFRDLNTACPKDEFPLPITDIMIDNTRGFKCLSWMPSPGIVKSRCILKMKNIYPSKYHQGCIATV